MTDITVVEAPVDITVDDDGSVVTVQAEEVTISISELGAQGIRGPSHESYPFTMQGELEVWTTETTQIPMDRPGVFQSIQATVVEAPTGAAVIVDVLINDVTIFAAPGDRPTIAAGDILAPTVTTFGTAGFTTDDRLTVHVAQVGSTTAGRGLVAVVRVLLT